MTTGSLVRPPRHRTTLCWRAFFFLIAVLLVTACGGGGGGSSGAGEGGGDGTGDDAVPDAPTGLTATAGDMTITLNWSAVEGVNSYTIYRSLSGGVAIGAGNSIAEGVTEPAHADEDVSNGTAYFYRVTAFNDMGESAGSNEVSATPQSPFSVVSAGGNHTLALRADATLWAWGLNSVGQAGDGTFTDVTRPQQIGSAADWIDIATGSLHSLALRNDGTLWAWGGNGSGQLGDGTTTNRTTPVQIGTDTDWAGIAAGRVHTLALKTDGTLWAWGGGTSGQLGNGASGTGVEERSPVQIGTDTGWRAITAGNDSSFGIKLDGTLWAWGVNNRGQLGDGTITQRTSPVQVTTDTDWASVAISSEHTVALKTDGTLWAWGRNFEGQLGDGTVTSRLAPVQIGTDTDWAVIGAGGRITSALRTDGTLWAWGLPVRLGNGDGRVCSSIATCQTTPIQIGTRADGEVLAVGTNNTFVLHEDNSLWAVGGNAFGQLGIGDITTDSATLVQVDTPRSWQSVVAGNEHVLALQADGTLWAWGRNLSGRLGDGTTTTRVSAVQIGTETTWQAVAAGAQHSLGLRSDGTLWGWGDNEYGQVGNGDTNDQHDPAQVGSSTDWTAVAASQFHSLGLRTNGTLWAWGRNDTWQLGDGTSVTNRINPVQIGTDTDWASVSAGYDYSLAIRSNGSLWAWGNNDAGQLGDGTTTSRNAPVQIGTATNWAAVSGGGASLTGSSNDCSSTRRHTLGLRTNGTLWAWGNNVSGQLGDGTTDDSPVPIPMQVGTDNDWVAMAAGCRESLAIKADGTLWRWGVTTNPAVSEPSPVQVGTQDTWAMVTAADHFRLGIRTDGSLWSWGEQAFGRLGDGQQLPGSDIGAPVPLP